jgi:SAM-dependent methyltransferase
MPWHWYEDYERGRPGYPPEALDVADLPPTATVLDLAAGTGKLTRLLLTRFGRVAAVEPDGRMRHLLARLCPEAEVIAGRADRIPLADASVDAVFIAQAFHWFDDEPAVAEITRVMRRHGTLVAMWNVPTGPPQPSIPAVERLLEQSWPNDFELPLDLSPNGWSPKAWQLAFTRSGSRSTVRHGYPTHGPSTRRGSSRSSARWTGSRGFRISSASRYSTA